MNALLHRSSFLQLTLTQARTPHAIEQSFSSHFRRELMLRAAKSCVFRTALRVTDLSWGRFSLAYSLLQMKLRASLLIRRAQQEYRTAKSWATPPWQLNWELRAKR